MPDPTQPVSKTCLNGWWDFQPRYDTATAMDVPVDGWLEGQYLVPSFWTKPLVAVRRKGQDRYQLEQDAGVYDDPDAEFLFDTFGYPSEWSKTRSAWVRRSLAIPAIDATRRYCLVFDAVMPVARLFVNGHEVASHNQPTLPLSCDVTEWLRAGENEIAVLIEDYARDEGGRALTPVGNTIPCDHSGIWQDVWLLERADVYLSDITIRTSTRTRTLQVEFEVTNASARARSVTLVPEIRDWTKDGCPETAPAVMSLPEVTLHLAPGATASAGTEMAWEDALWWYPERPKLYQLWTSVHDTGARPQPGAILEIFAERFGFREVWIEGPHLMLNDHPMHLFSDWGHKWTPYYYTEGWIRHWFRMIRDANMNHSRLHTHPHPPITLEIADEEGILITGEAGLHGSGGDQGAGSPDYWDAARDHVRRFVRRDKNHPSVVLWSVENEMRWNTKGEGASAEATMIQAELPKLRLLFEELDPTRPAYHDGDTSLWNERTQPIISRHYGKECAGIGWWDRTQPLHSGEMALYHYAGPNNTLHLGGDAVYASSDVVDRVAAEDATLIIETGRTLGVSCFGPWNLSCLENLRMTPDRVVLDYDDLTAPGVKPLQVPAQSSEFAFWELARDAGTGYTPNTSFAIQAHAFRPFAVIDRSMRSQAFTGRLFRRELFVVNDTSARVEGTLTVSLHRAEKTLHMVSHPVDVARGHVASRLFEFVLPVELEAGPLDYRVAFESDAQLLDTWQQRIEVAPRATQAPAEVRAARIGVYGPGTVDETLERLGCPFAHVNDLDAASLDAIELLLLEKRTVEPGSRQNAQVQAFVRGGGRVVVLEQETSLFPALTLVDKPVLGAFRRSYDHPVLEGLTDDQLFAWGDDPYPLLASDAYVAVRLYEKDDGRLMLPLLDAGEGGFGSGDLNLTPLFEAREGEGLILACQLHLTDKLELIPAAETLFLSLLQRAVTYRPEACEPPITVGGDIVDDLGAYVEAARDGRRVIVSQATPAALAAWSAALGQPLAPTVRDEVYQVIRVHDDEVLNGVSNEDLCGIETFSYTPATAANTRVGSLFLEPTVGLDPLLQTPESHLLRDLMVYGGHSEALRAHTLSRARDAVESPAVALGRVRVGKGEILFDQFAPESGGRARFDRLRHRLLANRGHRFAGSLLEGDAVPAARQNSPGYPRTLYVYNHPVDETLYRRMLESCLPSLERMLATPILNLGTWQTVTDSQGSWRAEELRAGGEVVLYHTIWSPKPRQNLETNLSVPNPEALIFLDLHGEGRVEVAVNGRLFQPVSLQGGGATVSDISLEMGGNHVLIRWVPDSTDSTLVMRWRNIMRQPEVGMLFDSAGSAN
jgi:beta-galactosidase